MDHPDVVAASKPWWLRPNGRHTGRVRLDATTTGCSSAARRCRFVSRRGPQPARRASRCPVQSDLYAAEWIARSSASGVQAASNLRQDTPAPGGRRDAGCRNRRVIGQDTGNTFYFTTNHAVRTSMRQRTCCRMVSLSKYGGDRLVFLRRCSRRAERCDELVTATDLVPMSERLRCDLLPFDELQPLACDRPRPLPRPQSRPGGLGPATCWARYGRLRAVGIDTISLALRRACRRGSRRITIFLRSRAASTNAHHRGSGPARDSLASTGSTGAFFVEAWTAAPVLLAEFGKQRIRMHVRA